MNRTLFDIFNFRFGFTFIFVIIIFILGMGTLLPMFLLYFLANHSPEKPFEPLPAPAPQVQPLEQPTYQPVADAIYYINQANKG